MPNNKTTYNFDRNRKRKALIAASVLAGLTVFGSAGFLLYEKYTPRLASVTANECSPSPTHYTFSSTGPNRFSVDLVIDGGTDQLDIVSRNDASERVLTDDFIKNARLVLADGAEEPLSYQGVGTWAVPHSQGDVLTIRYDIEANHDTYGWRNGKEEIAYNFDGSSFFTGWTVLLADYARQSCASLITFDLPEGWLVAAPWQKLGENSYRIENIRHLQKNGFAVGPSMPQFEVSAGQSKLVIVYERAVEHIAKAAAADADALFKYYQNAYGGPAGGSYHVFMVSDAGTDGGAFEASFAQRFSVPSNKADAKVWQHGFAHEIGHLWNGIALRPSVSSDAEWFKEGVTDYMTIKAKYATGDVSASRLEEKIATVIRRYYLALFAKGPQSLVAAGARKQDNRMLIYGGGAVFALLLDGEMHKAMGAGAFERTLKALYANRSEPYTQEQLMTALDQASNGRASAILADLDAGLMPEVMKQQLAGLKLGLGVFAPEELYVTFDVEDCDRFEGECIPAFMRAHK